MPPMPLSAPDEGSSGEEWGAGGLGRIKAHCGGSGVGHCPAVGTPKAWRGNKDPPMRLHGKDLDIAAITAAAATACLCCCLGILPGNSAG